MSFGKKIKHKAETAKGSAKRVIGRLTGNRRREAEGRADQAKGNLKQAADKAKDAFKP